MKQKESLIYLYCVTKRKPDRVVIDALTGSISAPGEVREGMPRPFVDEVQEKIYPIYSQGLYAIVTMVSPIEFGEEGLKNNLANMKWVEKNVRRHEMVVENIMENMTVLPFKFGTIFKTEDGVKKMLAERGADFKKTIAFLEGKGEWGVKIYCDFKKFAASAIKEDKETKDLDEEISASGKGKAYLLKKKQDELIKSVVTQKVSGYTRDSFERLKRTSLEAKINKTLPKEVTEKDEDMVLNAAFLIDKNRVKAFDDVLERLKTEYSDKGLVFEGSGPWPPYNFCLPKIYDRRRMHERVT